LRALFFITFLACFLPSLAQQKVSSLKGNADAGSVAANDSVSPEEVVPVALSSDKMPGPASATLSASRTQSSVPASPRTTPVVPAKASEKIEAPKK